MYRSTIFKNINIINMYYQKNWDVSLKKPEAKLDWLSCGSVAVKNFLAPV